MFWTLPIVIKSNCIYFIASDSREYLFAVGALVPGFVAGIIVACIRGRQCHMWRARKQSCTIRMGPENGLENHAVCIVSLITNDSDESL